MVKFHLIFQPVFIFMEHLLGKCFCYTDDKGFNKSLKTDTTKIKKWMGKQ
ncbi:hypothetical protein HMPREF1348_02467 [Enterococcus faecium 505]|uniref:Uncharacterized protein n=1 Tax=Enterococcus faecium 505 TaxID=1134806 RepID=J7CT67_ENTFC|nr:hypothetical protein M395_01570 [Enterococcus faecium T110]EJY43392.1 hypothetical protein HMPREF1348_02467 [Enterococcus faecium 505]MBL5005015.1 hypothetical protein [Enterococcus lactis]